MLLDCTAKQLQKLLHFRCLRMLYLFNLLFRSIADSICHLRFVLTNFNLNVT